MFRGMTDAHLSREKTKRELAECKRRQYEGRVDWILTNERRELRCYPSNTDSPSVLHLTLYSISFLPSYAS